MAPDAMTPFIKALLDDFLRNGLSPDAGEWPLSAVAAGLNMTGSFIDGHLHVVVHVDMIAPCIRAALAG